MQEDLPDRVAATEDIVDAFSEESGIEVELVSVAEDQFAQLITSAAAAGDLPDVIGGISLPQVRTLSANELVDTDAVAAVIESLDASTFSEKALELTADGDTQLAVPERVLAAAALLPHRPLRGGGSGRPRDVRRMLEAAQTLNTRRRRRLRRRDGPGRRLHRADVRAGRAGQRLPAGRRGRRDRARLLAVRGGVRVLRRPRHQLLRARRTGRRHDPGHLLRRATPRCSSGRASCSTRWPACAKTRSPRARSASTTRPSSRRTPES